MTPPIDFSKMNGLVPCIAQDAETDKVLMLGFMNEEALQSTQRDKLATFYSRSKKRLWRKGESSGNYLEVIDLLTDCDRDTVMLKVKPRGPACHTGKDTCFNEVNMAKGLGFLEKTIRDRKLHPKDGSYTNKLLTAGINAVAQKVGEEAVELIIEAKENNPERFLEEAADLVYHFLVLLAVKEMKLEDVAARLRTRHVKSNGSA